MAKHVLDVDRVLTTLWYALDADKAVDCVGGSSKGLSDAEAKDRLSAFGPNELPKKERDAFWKVFLRQFKSPLIYLLLAATVVSLMIEEFSDAAFIMAVVLINAVIGSIQEYKAETSAEALGKLIPNKVRVRRGGHTVEVESACLVPGDIVLVEAGTMVPADIRLIKATDLKVDESLLTGESVPVHKRHAPVLAEDTHMGDRINMLHAGSTVVSGRGEGVVAVTGVHTEIGRIAHALTESVAAKPPLVIRLEKFTKTIGMLVVGAVIVLVVVQLQRGMDLADVFFVAVALSVSAIPEGLPVAITIALSIGTARMAKRNVIVRTLPSVEGLGASTFIASDKTGTLTCNELTIKRLRVPGVGDVEIGGEGYAPRGSATLDGGALSGEAAEAVTRLARAGLLCNEAHYFQDETGAYRHTGDTVDVAFLVLAAKLGLESEAENAHRPQSGLIPFESERKYAATINKKPEDGHGMFVKGAAEVIVPMCRGIDVEAMLAEAEQLAADGYRVLAVADGHTEEVFGPEEADDRLTDLDFLGFAALIDPLREEVPEAVQRCKDAGISICIVTGDHPATALAIARDLGLAETRDQVITGSELTELASDEVALDEVTRHARVYARVEPTQKLTIVQSLQRNGQFVAVTGDGVNDAPALRAGNIGVAMGQGGTDVARGAADLILTDDNFASIVGGVEEGRIAYDNVRKVIYLLVSTGASEIVLFALAVISNMPLPLFAAQLLWLNLVTNGIQHVILTLEKGEPGVLKRRPRPPNQRVFDNRMIEQSVISGLYIGIIGYLYFNWAVYESGMSEFESRNALLMLMVLFENAHVFNCRSETQSVLRQSLKTNPWVIVGVPLAQLVHIGAAYVPGLNSVLEVAPIPAEQWIRLAAIALGLVVVMELYKVVRRNWLETRTVPITRA